MRMEKVRLTTLSESVRSFLARVKHGTGLVVEDEHGQTVAHVLPGEERATADYVDATPEQREEAFKEIKKIQRKVGTSMRKHGISEEDVVQEILKDD